MIRTWTEPGEEDLVADILAVDWSGGSWAGMTAANAPEAATITIPNPETETETKKKRKRRGGEPKFFDRKES